MRSRAPSAGFTLIEIIVVLAVVSALLVALAPAAFTYIRDAQVTQAQNDANRIAEAIGKFVQDTGVPPYKNNTTTASPKSQVKVTNTDFECLVSDTGFDFTTASDLTTNDSWTGGTGAVTCQSGSATRDTLENHLITNTPNSAGTARAYIATGKNAWKGPYLPSIPSDPWGNKYLVNIGKTDPSVSKGVWVISAGPNGNLETASDASNTSSISAGGDDIIARVR